MNKHNLRCLYILSFLEQKYLGEISDSQVRNLSKNVEGNNEKIKDLEMQLNYEKEGHKKQITKVAQLKIENSKLISKEKCYGGSYLG